MNAIQTAIKQAELNYATQRLESLFQSLEDDVSSFNRVKREMERLDSKIKATEKIIDEIQSGSLTSLVQIVDRIEAAKAASITKA